jgi:hypothetical protein
MIMTFGTSMILLLSVISLLLGLGLLDTTYRIFRRWRKADSEEEYELEKGYYLIFAAACITLAIRLSIVPIYFWTMQSLVPAIPGAMCLWGVFNALPQLTWPALVLKLVLPSLYSGWLILAAINIRCKRNPLVRNLAGLLIAISPLLLIDSVLDLTIFTRLSPVQVSCCSSAIDVGPRLIPPSIGILNGQSIMLVLFLLLSSLFIVTSLISARKQRFEWTARIFSIMLIPATVLTMSNVLTPWTLHLPFHYCPFCLVAQSPTSIPFVLLYWVGISASWWTLLTRTLARKDTESMMFETKLRTTLWKASSTAVFIGLLVVTVNLTVSLA